MSESAGNNINFSDHAREIRARREVLKTRLSAARNVVRHVEIDFEHLRADCRHENTYVHYDYAGGSDKHCSDCGELLF